MTKHVPLDRLRDLSRQRSFGRRARPADPAERAEDKAESPEERVEWPISR